MPTVILTATPSSPPTYNPSMADTFSWVPVQGAGRPLFARTTYIANPEDISVSLSANNLNVNLGDVENLLTQTNTLLAAVTATSNRINGFVIPNYNKIKNFYYGNTSNISSVQYIENSTVVAELSFTYVDPTSAENARLDQIIKL